MEYKMIIGISPKEIEAVDFAEDGSSKFKEWLKQNGIKTKGTFLEK